MTPVRCEAINTPRHFYANLQLAENTATLIVTTINCIGTIAPATAFAATGLSENNSGFFSGYF
jgi:hypothetical protein